MKSVKLKTNKMAESKTSDIGPGEYKVESIVDKRVTEIGSGEIVEYLIKWLGYASESNTWEPMANLFCDDLIEQFEQNLVSTKSRESVAGPPKTKLGGKRKLSKDIDDKSSVKQIINGSILKSKPKNGERKKSVEFEEVTPQIKRPYKKRSDAVLQIDPELEPEKIVGVADSGGELMFLIKWKGKKH